MKIAVINAKGGTGKTTSAINLAHAIANSKRKVLICDLDPQASASFSLGFNRDSLYPSIADVFFENYPIQKAIRTTSIKGVDILTASIALSSFDIIFSQENGRESKLKNSLSKLKGYDVVIFDSPPTLGLLPLNAIVASDRLIVPVQPQYLALEGLQTLFEALERFKSGVGYNATLMGILLTQVDRRSKAAGEIIELIRKNYKNQVFKTEIRTNTRLAEAPSFGKSIFQYDFSSTGAQTYQSLAHEVLSAMKKGK